MAPMTGTEVAMVDFSMTMMGTNKKVRAPRRSKHSVKWLERELAEARADLQIAGHRLDATNILLRQKNDELVQARSERDDAYNERDEARRNCNEIDHMAEVDYRDHQRTEDALLASLMQLKEANAELGTVNKRNFEKSRRNADVAAVLVSHLVAVTGLAPAKIMLELFNVAVQMGVDLREASEEVRNALKRGYAAQVDDVATAPPSERDMFQDVVERYGMPPDFSGYNLY